ncbi:hypothetical protein [Phycisphaera mikurensis]|uniref:Uncharacterized protein n=1 Tax=Phycisphaera mikurensis (strain NBRC 102666 / KCTC 22515 / FYK2301M01) TaxID=1142394 RepID=I0IH18_PHYMF|nr:hypothetical protein [Phycisphaera mikurensis]MBB6440811.1 hypothetical protein [Phycisphaera mikurensis]BAM04556.1 hypothetical protein PSMK_23970 [Phycisphaera mikurensis NBRC 102666]
MHRLAAVCACLLPLPGCLTPPPEPAPAAPPPAPAGVVLPGGADGAKAAWYDDRRDGESEVVAGPAVAERTQSVTRTRGGLNVTASGEVRDTLDRRTRRTRVRTAE